MDTGQLLCDRTLKGCRANLGVKSKMRHLDILHTSQDFAHIFVRGRCRPIDAACHEMHETPSVFRLIIYVCQEPIFSVMRKISKTDEAGSLHRQLSASSIIVNQSFSASPFNKLQPCRRVCSGFDCSMT